MVQDRFENIFDQMPYDTIVTAPNAAEYLQSTEKLNWGSLNVLPYSSAPITPVVKEPEIEVTQVNQDC